MTALLTSVLFDCYRKNNRHNFVINILLALELLTKTQHQTPTPSPIAELERCVYTLFNIRQKYKSTMEHRKFNKNIATTNTADKLTQAISLH